MFITSQDEESGLLDLDYEEFAKARYSSQTIDQASAVFSWGDQDTKSLKKNILKVKIKFIKQALQDLICGNQIFLIIGFYLQMHHQNLFY